MSRLQLHFVSLRHFRVLRAMTKLTYTRSYSFMPPEHLRILRQESSAGLRSIAEQKDHLKHQSPLSVVEDNAPRHKRHKSWSKSFSKLPILGSLKSPLGTPHSGANKKLHNPPPPTPMTPAHELPSSPMPMEDDDGHEADDDSEGEDAPLQAREMPLSERVQYWNPVRGPSAVLQAV